MSENDIQNGRIISQRDLDKSDLEWLDFQHFFERSQDEH